MILGMDLYSPQISLPVVSWGNLGDGEILPAFYFF